MTPPPKTIPTANMPRSDWLILRRRSIGGSDAAAVLGLTRYTSPMTVWGEKTGRILPQPDNEAMRQGREFEPIVAKRFCEETGKKVHRRQQMIYNPLYPYSHGDIDRKVEGESAGLECKTMSDPYAAADLENGKYPPAYYVQCVHYLAVTGYDRWYLAIMVLGRGFYIFTIERDQAEIDALMAQETAFWENYVLPDVPPPPDGTEATTDALGQIYRDDSAPDTRIDEDTLCRYEEIRREMEELSRQLEENKQRIMMQMAESERGYSDSYTVQWKKRKHTTYDMKKFIREHPEIDMKPYQKITEYRQFNVKE